MLLNIIKKDTNQIWDLGHWFLLMFASVFYDLGDNQEIKILKHIIKKKLKHIILSKIKL